MCTRELKDVIEFRGRMGVNSFKGAGVPCHKRG